MTGRSFSMFTKTVLLIILICLLPTPAIAAPIDFTQWTFENDQTSGAPVPAVDLTSNAVAAAGSGLTNESFPAGFSSLTAWSFTGWSTGNLDTADYFEFMVDLTNYGHITLSFDERRSSTGIRDLEVHYSTDGTNFTQIVATVTNVPDDTNWRSHSFDLGSGTAVDLAIRGQSTVYFRIYGYNAEGSTGTWRIDNVTFNATTNPTAVTFSGLNAASPFAALAMGLVAATGLVVLRKRK
jgi:hypothetical protein